VPTFHQRQEERCAACLAVDAAVRVELDIREPRVRVQLRRPVTVVPEERAVQPIVERSLRLEGKIESFKAEPYQPAGLLQAGVALCLPNLGIALAIQVREGPPALEHFAALGRELQLYPTTAIRWNSHVKRTHVPAALTLGLA